MGTVYCVRSDNSARISDIARMIGLTRSSRIWGLNDGIGDISEDDYYFDMFQVSIRHPSIFIIGIYG